MARFTVLATIIALSLATGGCTQSESGTLETAEMPEATEVAETAQVAESPEAGDIVDVMVYKSPTCGCCSKWVSHMEEAGFSVQTQDVQDVTPFKQRFGLPAGMASCHTAIVGGYVVEGHVPAETVKRMLEEQPDIAGIAVPGMPIGSPGMEQGNRVDSYDIVTFDAQGRTSVYESR